VIDYGFLYMRIQVRKRIGICLRHRGCKVDTANDGADALRKMKRQWYRAVFCDGNMPVLDGYTAVKRCMNIA